MQSYNATEVEKKWQQKWKESGLHKADLENPERPKYYNLTMFPYPSGDKLHIGHWYNYGPVDTWGRYMKMKGFEVFQPMGFDSFGLPAENYAIKTGVHPAETTRKNIDKMKEQIGAIGGMYDLDLNLETSSPEYYKWTQWVFLQLYKQGLAYRKEAPVNWCPSCMTVLANEQVDSGICERCKTQVVQKNLRQWFFKITAYSDKLLDYTGLDWPEKTILMQKHWIGRSEGARFEFKVFNSNLGFDVFSTRPDTLFGATYCVLSPEHPLVERIVTDEQRAEIHAYREQVKTKSEMERTELNRNKSGAFTGAYAVNPASGKQIPIWIADYVLMSYGAGAIMAVPAHDQRDFEFAQKYNLPVVCVIDPGDASYSPEEVKKWRVEIEAISGSQENFINAWIEKRKNILEGKTLYDRDGILINSDFLNGLKVEEAKKKMILWLEAEKIGQGIVNFRLRDWLISRQRYWGAPIPIINCEKCGEVPVPDSDLPVVHPHVEDYVPKGTSPLATVEEFVNVKCPTCGGDAKREVDTMDTFVCSSWYFLRYPDAGNSEQAWRKERANKWLPVDMYIGGPEHACMHLLYARFIHQVMHDLGHVEAKEPFKRLVHQGMVTKDGAKMSKSKGNVVSPDEFVAKYGSDVFRMYLMFMGPFTEGGDWNDRGIMGVARFVDRFYRMMQEDGTGEGMDSAVHQAVARASEAVKSMTFNVAIASLMELTNAALKGGLNKAQKEIVCKVLAPLAPHLAEEVWAELGHSESIFKESWPEAEAKFLVKSSVTFAVQVNGKLRATVDLAPDVSKEEALAAARAEENVAKYLTGEVVKEIFVPGKIIGFVVKV